ncbi:uncharacterized protein SCHCODRAFT_02559108 [Schizophyllum commune H4-8]|uniref:uncharacterized protein n=1 Tax=Schizophyllum commune (strain H4-8 / FGSC 9210) TaxID=578458 RepID=UPI00215F43C4|nr:uncharacterized protein SCHCODRAFT_02559108 [Schizophyllum commune H4-8]KAI5899005.1 hypothetical protein SCHCODRAFT_02559108 [Schizophyllum commune H4-8]
MNGLDLLSNAASQLSAAPPPGGLEEGLRTPLNDITQPNASQKRPPSPPLTDTTPAPKRPRRTCTQPKPAASPPEPPTPTPRKKRGRPPKKREEGQQPKRAPGRPRKDKPAASAVTTPNANQALLAASQSGLGRSETVKDSPATPSIDRPPSPGVASSKQSTAGRAIGQPFPSINFISYTPSSFDFGSPPPLDPPNNSFSSSNPPSPVVAAGAASLAEEQHTAASVEGAVPKPSQKQRKYSVADKSALLEVVLGDNVNGDKIFDKLQVASNKVWRMVLEALGGKLPSGPVTEKQLSSLYNTLLTTFKQLYEFRNFTGRGADADDYDWDDEDGLALHLRNSKSKGCAIDNLNAANSRLFVRKGWYDLFVNRYKDNPKVIRPVARSSAAELSEVDDFDEDDEVELVPSPTKSRLPKSGKLPASATVSEPKGAPRRGRPRKDAKEQTKIDTSGLNTYFEVMAKSEEQSAALRQQRYERVAIEKKVDLAQKIIDGERASPGTYTFQVVDNANRILAEFLSLGFGDS